MKISAIIFCLLTTLFSCLQACVTYNPGSQTYTVDSYGSTELSACRPRKPCPIFEDPTIETESYRWEGKPKIVKQPRPVDWDDDE